MKVIKRDKSVVEFDAKKIENVLRKVFKNSKHPAPVKNAKEVASIVINKVVLLEGDVFVEKIQDIIRDTLIEMNYSEEAKSFILYRDSRRRDREMVAEQERFIENYKKSSNTANSTIDDNSNVGTKNIGVLSTEIHKPGNIKTSRGMITNKLKKIYGNSFNAKQYVNDIENHIIYKNDESTFPGPISPYCASISMYPFLIDGLKKIGGLSASPKNLDSFCGMFINLIFAVSAQFAGAVATSEFLMYFDYFARLEFGEDYIEHSDEFYKIGSSLRKLMNKTGVWFKNTKELAKYDFKDEELNKLRDDIVFESDRPMTKEELDEWLNDVLEKPETKTRYSLKDNTRSIKSQIHQHFQQIIYSINQPAAARGLQAAFVNFSYFDKAFFKGMFGEFYFPDGSQPIWETLNWLQKDFMMWFNAERLKTILTFPVESFALVNIDGKWEDEENAKFVADEYARGHSFFTYISDTVDSLSSCCFHKDTKILWKSSTKGVQLTTLEELHNLNWEPDKKNLRIFHNGSWVSGKSIKLENRPMYKVTTYNNKEFIMTDNHINVTLDGEKDTSKLTTNDYLMFNTIPLQAIPENDEHLSYAQGFVVGAFLGDGSFGSEINGTIYDINFSQNINKYEKMMKYIDIANKEVGGESKSVLSEIYNNVYPVRISSKNLAAFIMKWTNWKRGTYSFNKELNLNSILQSYEFRKGILDGWYNTDGGNSNRCYTSSKKLSECMEVLITSLGMQSIINISDRTDEPVIIREKEYSRNYPVYCVSWYELSNHRTNKDKENSWIKKNNSIYFKIKSIEKVEYTDDVYCIECSNKEEPYFTLPCGLITHNCRLKNMVQTKEFNFTNGNMGVMTGSKSVISLNLNRITQDAHAKWLEESITDISFYDFLKQELITILERVYKYHTAYNESLKDMYNANLLPVYKAGFIDLNKQYLTIGLNGLNEAAEFLGMECNLNDEYKNFCEMIFSTVKEQNLLHKTKELTFNTEQVPAESLAVKNYNWDKEDGYWVPENRNLYASYIFIPSDEKLSVLDKIKLHGRDYIGEYLDGGSAAHINLSEHLTSNQYFRILNYSAKVGCQYFTFNIPNACCDDCGFIAKQPFDVCPKCGSKNISLYDRIIGYLTKISNWSNGRQIEQKTRVYSNFEK